MVGDNEWTIQREFHKDYSFYHVLDPQMCPMGEGGFTPEDAWKAAQEDSKMSIPALENMTKDTLNAWEGYQT